jgi:hypothetical protein
MRNEILRRRVATLRRLAARSAGHGSGGSALADSGPATREEAPR